MAKYVSKGCTVTFSTLNAKILDISLDGEECDMVDVTDQASTNQWKEFLAAFKDAGQASILGLFDPDGTIPATGTTATITITWPSGATNKYSCTAFLQRKGVGAALGDKLTMPFVFKLSGEPNWAAT